MPSDQMLLARLRAATHDAHEALHVHPALMTLTTDALDRAYYVNALKKFYGFHAPLERALAVGVTPGFEHLIEPMATGSLERDLRFWKVAPSTVATMPREAGGVEDRIAYLYLREGSTLGGQQIARNVRQAFGLDHDGVAFFTGRGRDTGPAWKQFCALMDGAGVIINIDRTAEAAIGLFGDLGSWLTKETE